MSSFCNGAATATETTTETAAGLRRATSPTQVSALRLCCTALPSSSRRLNPSDLQEKTAQQPSLVQSPPRPAPRPRRDPLARHHRRRRQLGSPLVGLLDRAYDLKGQGHIVFTPFRHGCANRCPQPQSQACPPPTTMHHHPPASRFCSLSACRRFGLPCSLPAWPPSFFQQYQANQHAVSLRPIARAKIEKGATIQGITRIPKPGA